MSIASIKLPFFQISPHISAEPKNLVATTSIIYRILNLFSYCRTVDINKDLSVININVRWLWIFNSMTSIPFADIKYIDSTSWEVAEDVGLNHEGFGRRDVTEVIYVQAYRKSTSVPVDLFRFVGDGVGNNGLVDMFVSSTTRIDFVGHQEEASLKYIDLVAKYTGAPKRIDFKETWRKKEKKYTCTGCSHVFAVQVASCVYCGSDEIISKEAGSDFSRGKAY